MCLIINNTHENMTPESTHTQAEVVHTESPSVSPDTPPESIGTHIAEEDISGEPFENPTADYVAPNVLNNTHENLTTECTHTQAEVVHTESPSASPDAPPPENPQEDPQAETPQPQRTKTSNYKNVKLARKTHKQNVPKKSSQVNYTRKKKSFLDKLATIFSKSEDLHRSIGENPDNPVIC